MAKEQDRETDKQAILSETEGHRKQLLRLETHFLLSNRLSDYVLNYNIITTPGFQQPDGVEEGKSGLQAGH